MENDLPIIDIHNHLLPGVDDGSEDMDMSIELIEQGLENGVSEWVLTPHILDEFTREIDELHCGIFDHLKAEVERRSLPVRLYLASEIMFQMDVEQVKQRRSSTFDGNGRYFLMEFPMTTFPREAEDVLYQYQLAGMKPIIAHPERNQELGRRTSRIADMAARGILFQVNARSLALEQANIIRRTAEELILSGSAHFVASDAHHPERRPAGLREAYDRIAELAGEDTAIRLLSENPRKAVEGRGIEFVIPEPQNPPPFWRRILDLLHG